MNDSFLACIIGVFLTTVVFTIVLYGKDKTIEGYTELLNKCELEHIGIKCKLKAVPMVNLGDKQ